MQEKVTSYKTGSPKLNTYYGALMQRALIRRMDIDAHMVLISTTWGRYSRWPRVYPWWVRALQYIFQNAKRSS